MKEIHHYKTYCNPLSIPGIPRGKDSGNVMAWSGEATRDYRSISDPSVLYFEGKWYLYPSYGILWESEDFVHWKSIPCTPYDAPYRAPTAFGSRHASVPQKYPCKQAFLLVA